MKRVLCTIVIFIFTIMGVSLPLLSCSELKSEDSSSHKYSEAKGRDGSIDLLIDESSPKSTLELIDFENGGSYDVIQLSSSRNKYMVIIFEQENKPIIMKINTNERDSQKWTATIMIDAEVFMCARGNAGLWFFKDKSDSIHYIHLLAQKGGYRIDSIDR